MLEKKYTPFLDDLKSNISQIKTALNDADNNHNNWYLVKKNFPLSKISYYKTGGPADLLITAEHEQAVSAVIRLCLKHALPFYVLGECSNMIINDHGFKGVILRLGKGFSKVHLNDDLELTAGAGLLKKKALSLCAANNLAGLTGLTGVPGQIGGGLAMNAGTKYGTIADSLVIIKYADSLGKIKIIDQNRISSNYRSSLIPANSIALEAVFRLKRATGPKDYVKQKIDSILAERKSKQPLRFPSCGSTFKNPPGHSAGRLIEACGLKGLKSGNAEISEKHANFILNLGNASSADILFLIEKAQKRVKEKFDISLEREVIILGEKGPEN